MFAGVLDTPLTLLVLCILDYNPSNGFEILKTQPISKAQARQRCGRAGRETPGICYRLYPEKSFFQLKEDAVPEIQRCNLKSKKNIRFLYYAFWQKQGILPLDEVRNLCIIGFVFAFR